MKYDRQSTQKKYNVLVLNLHSSESNTSKIMTLEKFKYDI